MDYIAIALFVGLFACANMFVGGNVFPSLSADQEIQLALAASFMFGIVSAWRKDGWSMGLAAAAMFVALFVYYEDIIGRMTGTNLHLALFCAFVFGIVCGYRVKKKRRN